MHMPLRPPGCPPEHWGAKRTGLQRLPQVLVLKLKCESRESNPDGFPHWILSPARLPIPPLSRVLCRKRLRQLLLLVARPRAKSGRLEFYHAATNVPKSPFKRCPAMGDVVQPSAAARVLQADTIRRPVLRWSARSIV